MKATLMSVDKIKVKSTHLLPKVLLKRVKQYALDNDTTVTSIVIEALEMFLTTKERGKK